LKENDSQETAGKKRGGGVVLTATARRTRLIEGRRPTVPQQLKIHKQTVHFFSRGYPVAFEIQ